MCSENEIKIKEEFDSELQNEWKSLKKFQI